MKNIHVLPTNKPSRLLYLGTSKELTLLSLALTFRTFERSTQHIYITSDEEIKEGDWFYCPTTDIVNHCESDYHSKKLIKPKRFKIILTTDPDLIKDGVQAIDDDFLEWFVKNPSCEKVEVEFIDDNWGYYEIIIPKEEPKQETLEDITLEEVFGSAYCHFSVVENKLAILYRNQEQLLKAIKLLSNEKRNT